MRQRWFGATGRKVPEIALEGSLDVEGALVVDDLSQRDAIHEAHLGGTPVVVRAATPEAIVAALSLGEVACVLVPNEELLDIDLAQITYG